MVCPKCGYSRQPRDTAPEWQCPSCQVAYAKVTKATSPPQANDRVAVSQPSAPPLNPVADDDRELTVRNDLLASGQRIAIVAILITLVLRSILGSQLISPIIAALLLAAVAVYSLVGLVRMCTGLGDGQGRKILLMVLAFVPLINLIALVYVNVRATKALRAAGWTVGLFGARP
jgi:hypothetical protein